MMTETEHLLVILSEECGEVVKEVAKALRFGLGEKMTPTTPENRERIETELADVFAVADMLKDRGVLILAPEFLEARTIEKRAKVRQYMEYARGCGTLEPARGVPTTDVFIHGRGCFSMKKPAIVTPTTGLPEEWKAFVLYCDDCNVYRLDATIRGDAHSIHSPVLTFARDAILANAFRRYGRDLPEEIRDEAEKKMRRFEAHAGKGRAVQSTEGRDS